MFIGEIGINHNGDLNIALKLIKEAKRCGIDVVKFQKRDPDLCVPEHQKNQKRIWKGKEMTYLEYKYDVEFGKEEYDIINAYCKEIGIAWTASVWDVKSVAFMKQYTDDIPFIKIPSACITDEDVCTAVRNWGIPVILSDGMSTTKEIQNAITFLYPQIIGLLHCNSSYPASEDELDLNVIRGYQDDWSFKIGYSGHEVGILPTIIAVGLGAEIIERHITLDKNMEGSDQKCSLDINDLEELIPKIWRVQKMLGNYNVTVYDSEKVVRDRLRK